MKHIQSFIVSIFILSITSVAGQAEKRSIDPFDRISVFGNIDVDLLKSDTFKIVINAQGANLEEITSIVDEKELKIRLVTDLLSDAKVTMRIYHKDIQSVDATGGANISSDMLLKNEKLNLRAGSGGNIYLYNIEVNSIDARVTKGSTIVVAGTAKTQNVDASAGGAYSAFELESEIAYVDAAAGGVVKVYVTQKLDAKATSKGYVGYRGSPVIIDELSNLGGKVIEDNSEEE